ncbi:MAG: ribonuclease R [Mycoplasmatales bacterium]
MNIELLEKLCNIYNKDLKLIEQEEPTKEIKFLLLTLSKNKITTVTKKGYLKKLKKEKLYLGKLQKKNNFGFLINKNNHDMYVSQVEEYFDEDIVLTIQSFARGKNDAVKILELIERPNAYLVVKKEADNKIIELKPKLDKRIILQGMDAEQIKIGTIFSVKIKALKSNKVITTLHNIIADENDPDLEMKLILDKYNIQVNFAEETIAELDKVEEEINPQELKERINLKEQIFFTIDGADSKDLDDAISLIKEGNDYRLYVSIADVSHYLTEGSNLNKEAQERATSVYFIDRVVPMIPKKISNGICSLHAGVDRLTMTCEMLITNHGVVKETKIYNSVINSKYRLTYNEVNDMLKENNKELIKKYADIYAILQEMNKLAKILNNKRIKRGSFNLEDTEAKFKLDENQNIIDIVPVNRQDSEKLIEEFMIIANESVTKYVMAKKEAFIYRVHGTPNTNKLANLQKLLVHLNIKTDINFEELRPEDFKVLLDSVEDTTFKRILSKLIVRSMQKAIYSEENIGHFGLASHNYTHFTSPIRRYPDLLVHRLLKTYIKAETLTAYQKESIKLIAAHSSEKEVSAIKAEQEIEDRKKTKYMQQFIGQEFKAVVSGVEDYGIFVELDNTIRGLIRFADLKNYKTHNLYQVEFMEEEPTLSFGQEIQVSVLGVDLVRGLVDFLPTGYEVLTEEEKLKRRQDKRKREKSQKNNNRKANAKKFKYKSENKAKSPKNDYYKKQAKNKKKNKAKKITKKR